MFTHFTRNSLWKNPGRHLFAKWVILHENDQMKYDDRQKQWYTHTFKKCVWHSRLYENDKIKYNDQQWQWYTLTFKIV